MTQNRFTNTSLRKYEMLRQNEIFVPTALYQSYLVLTVKINTENSGVLIFPKCMKTSFRIMQEELGKFVNI